MNYTEVTIECKNTDEVCDKLTAMGIDGFVIETEDDFKAFLENNRQYWDYVDESLEESYRGVSRVKFYVEDNDEGASLLGRVGVQDNDRARVRCGLGEQLEAVLRAA